MRRRTLIASIGGATIARPIPARTQQKRMPVIGHLGISSPGLFAPLLAAFHRGLGEAGYTEGRNVAIEYRWAEGQEGRLPELAADLVNRKVDVITTQGGTLAAAAAKNATSTIPIVFETGFDPVASGLVASMARPGGNLTGISILTSELNPKRLELLAELVPQVQVVALLVNPNNLSADSVVTAVRQAAQARDLRLQVVTVTTEDEYEGAFRLAREQAGALLVGNDPVFFSRRDRLVELAVRHAIPAIFEWREFVEIGGLLSYGTSVAEMHREKGRYVGRILTGAKPADLPVQQPTKFELVINLKTAKTLGMKVPQSLLARADEVIE